MKLFHLLTMVAMPLSVGAQLAVGDEVCVEGFVMDFFCISRGTLFDNPSVVSLANPVRDLCCH